MANFYEDNEDLRYYLERGVDWAPLVRVTEMGFRDPDGFKTVEEAVETYADVLTLIGEFVGEEVAPRVSEIDAAHPRGASGGAQHGGHDPERGRLARAVGAEDPDDLPLRNRERDSGHGGEVAVATDEVLRFDHDGAR